MKRKRRPHLRLKAVREIIGDTQEALARRIGVSYSYVLSVETGQREMSQKFADLMMHATGVSPDWLMNATASPRNPMSHSGMFRNPVTSMFYRLSREPFTREWFEKWAEKPRLPFHQFDLDGDEERLIDDYCTALASMMRGAAQKGRFNVCAYNVHKMIDATKSKLGLKVRDDDAELPIWLFGEEFDSEQETTTPTEIMAAWRILSPAGKTKWANAFAGNKGDREALLEEVSGAHAAIKASFSATRKPRSSPSRGRKA